MKRILVTDDEDVLRMLIVDTLEDEGYEIDEAGDGEEAMEMYNQKQYDLLILDYMMPNMTGLEVLKKIRESATTATHQKILMLTAKGQAQDKQEMLDSGADSILIKPFSPIELIDLVNDLVKK
ncbi:response regulator receiver [Halalkalibacter wakoensis JCM 9140]|uniref:Response regulator receiver n=1 Tax=Halalkalibacter wakoensis JCM 9140 TaxID=1236970 RepID=W4Q151_9BACI|nr:response regulator transcription factor [Halalkalibacter wakoensis]GAE25428.1 response regulator receiver [Halalkalibacter wakoensis JCM 9140]